MNKISILATFFALTIIERIGMAIRKINGILENPKTERIGLIAAVVIFLGFMFYVLFSNGCSSTAPNNFETLYKNSQVSLEVSNQLLVEEKTQSAIAEKEYRVSEKLLRNSLDSLYKYVSYKTDSLYSIIAIKDILLRSNDADVDSMLLSINDGVLRYINKLRAKYGLDDL